MWMNICLVLFIIILVGLMQVPFIDTPTSIKREDGLRIVALCINQCGKRNKTCLITCIKQHYQHAVENANLAPKANIPKKPLPTSPIRLKKHMQNKETAKTEIPKKEIVKDDTRVQILHKHESILVSLALGIIIGSAISIPLFLIFRWIKLSKSLRDTSEIYTADVKSVSSTSEVAVWPLDHECESRRKLIKDDELEVLRRLKKSQSLKSASCPLNDSTESSTTSSLQPLLTLEHKLNTVCPTCRSRRFFVQNVRKPLSNNWTTARIPSRNHKRKQASSSRWSHKRLPSTLVEKQYRWKSRWAQKRLPSTKMAKRVNQIKKAKSNCSYPIARLTQNTNGPVKFNWPLQTPGSWTRCPFSLIGMPRRLEGAVQPVPKK